MNIILSEQAADESIAKFGGTELDKKSFLTVLEFLEQYPGSLSIKKGNPSLDDPKLLSQLSNRFFKTRAKINGPKPSKTVPDDMVSYILEIYFDYSFNEIQRIKTEHKDSMSAENIIGFLLEKYIGNILENHGWTWCSGDFVHAIDFIKKGTSGKWHLLQIKNRVNSENSSSSAIRAGTNIQKWFRSFANKNATNWDTFPDEETRHLLSENGFKDFVKNYLLAARK